MKRQLNSNTILAGFLFLGLLISQLVLADSEGHLISSPSSPVSMINPKENPTITINNKTSQAFYLNNSKSNTSECVIPPSTEATLSLKDILSNLSWCLCLMIKDNVTICMYQLSTKKKYAVPPHVANKNSSDNDKVNTDSSDNEFVYKTIAAKSWTLKIKLTFQGNELINLTTDTTPILPAHDPTNSKIVYDIVSPWVCAYVDTFDKNNQQFDMFITSYSQSDKDVGN